MQHTEADQNLAVERYLLGEMTTSEMEQFEEHLFLCPECAESVKTGATFVENARAVFKEPAPQAARESTPANHKVEAGILVEDILGPLFRPGSCRPRAAVRRRLPAPGGDSGIAGAIGGGNCTTASRLPGATRRLQGRGANDRGTFRCPFHRPLFRCGGGERFGV